MFGHPKKTKMKKFFTKISIVLLVCLTGLTLSSKAQTWTVGLPVPDSTILTFGYGALGGCFPNPDATFNFSMPAVTGISYYMVVTSVDSNSAFINPGNDTLKLHDTIPILTGTNLIELYYYSAAPAVTPVEWEVKASGIPSVAGQGFPCNVNPIWLSNLGICPDGLSKSIGTACTVANNTGIPATPSNDLVLTYPVSKNNYTLEVLDASPVKGLSVYDITGKKMLSASPLNTHGTLNCDALSNGVYFVSVLRNDGTRVTGKFTVAGR